MRDEEQKRGLEAGGNSPLRNKAERGALELRKPSTLAEGGCLADEAHQSALVGYKVALQGNLDPCALFAPKEVLLQEAENVLQKMGNQPGHVFNLGHGILPNTPVDNAKALVEFVKEESAKLRIK